MGKPPGPAGSLPIRAKQYPNLPISFILPRIVFKNLSTWIFFLPASLNPPCWNSSSFLLSFSVLRAGFHQVRATVQPPLRLFLLVSSSSISCSVRVFQSFQFLFINSFFAFSAEALDGRSLQSRGTEAIAIFDFSFIWLCLWLSV